MKQKIIKKLNARTVFVFKQRGNMNVKTTDPTTVFTTLLTHVQQDFK